MLEGEASGVGAAVVKKSSMERAKNMGGENIQAYINSVKETYLLTLGEFSYYKLEESNQFLWLFFVVATVFNLIIMLNLLVSVITEAYTEVRSNSIEFMYKERAKTMNSLYRLKFMWDKFFSCCKKEEMGELQLPFIVTKMDQDDQDDEE